MKNRFVFRNIFLIAILITGFNIKIINAQEMNEDTIENNKDSLMKGQNPNILDTLGNKINHSQNIVNDKKEKLKGTEWFIWLPLLVSIIALFFTWNANRTAKAASLTARDANKLSIQANSLANKANDTYKDEITLTHRPYVWVEVFGSINEKGIIDVNNNKLMLLVINSPAKIINEEHYYYAIDENGKEVEIETEVQSNLILYPSTNVQYTRTIENKSATKINHYLNKKLDVFRECKLQYKMLSKDDIYEYSAKWRFNITNNVWEIVESPVAN